MTETLLAAPEANPAPADDLHKPLRGGKVSSGKIALGEHYDEEKERHNTEAWLNERTGLYEANSFLISALAAEKGVHLSPTIDRTLKGEGQIGDRDTTGLARASTELGKAINGTMPKNELFDTESLTTKRVDWHKLAKPPTDEGFDMPDVSELEGIKYAGRAGSMYLQILHDIIRPYEQKDGDGYTVLSQRESGNAYMVGRGDSAKQDERAQLCSNTELHFSTVLNAKKKQVKELEVGGEVVALQKRTGDHTALLVRPVVLNGVRLPVGSVVIAETDESGNHKFAFGRLSGFCFEDAPEAEREFASVFEAEKARMQDDPEHDFRTALIAFNKIVGRGQSPGAEEGITQLNEAISSNRVARMLKVTDTKAAELAVEAFKDKKDAESKHERGYYERENDPKQRAPALERLIQERLSTARTYGQDAIDQARKLLDRQRELAATT